MEPTYVRARQWSLSMISRWCRRSHRPPRWRYGRWPSPRRRSRRWRCRRPLLPACRRGSRPRSASRSASPPPDARSRRRRVLRKEAATRPTGAQLRSAHAPGAPETRRQTSRGPCVKPVFPHRKLKHIITVDDGRSFGATGRARDRMQVVGVRPSAAPRRSARLFVFFLRGDVTLASRADQGAPALANFALL